MDSIAIFQDIVTSSIVKNNFEILDNEKEVLLLNDDYALLIENLKNNSKQAKEFLNISFLSDEYEEAVTRLFLYFADIKIQKLIYKFEQDDEKDFSLLQQVEDLKKKKEIYQNTV